MIKTIKTYHRGLSTLTKYHLEAAGLQDFLHHSDLVSYATFHVRKFCVVSCKVYRDILRFYRGIVDLLSKGGTVVKKTIVLHSVQIADVL